MYSHGPIVPKLSLPVHSKSQYEKRLKAWNFRKHVKAGNGEWNYILRETYRRKQLGKKSIVSLRGVVVSEEKIKRRMYQYSDRQLQAIRNPVNGRD